MFGELRAVLILDKCQKSFGERPVRGERAVGAGRPGGLEAARTDRGGLLSAGTTELAGVGAGDRTGGAFRPHDRRDAGDVAALCTAPGLLDLVDFEVAERFAVELELALHVSSPGGLRASLSRPLIERTYGEPTGIRR